MKILVDVRPRATSKIFGARVRDSLIATLGPEHRPIDSPLVIRLRFLFRRNESTEPIPNFESLPALTRAVLDQCAGLVYSDERHIVAVHAGKEFANVEGVEISW